MTHYAFRLLSPTVQLYWVLKHGTSAGRPTPKASTFTTTPTRAAAFLSRSAWITARTSRWCCGAS